MGRGALVRLSQRKCALRAGHRNNWSSTWPTTATKLPPRTLHVSVLQKASNACGAVAAR